MDIEIYTRCKYCGMRLAAINLNNHIEQQHKDKIICQKCGSKLIPSQYSFHWECPKCIMEDI